MKPVLLVFLFSISLFFVGCFKGADVAPDKISDVSSSREGLGLEAPTVLDGTLRFKKFSDFQHYLTSVARMSDSSYQAFTSKLGVTTTYSKFAASSDTAKVLRSVNTAYARLTDADGCVYVGGYVLFYSDRYTKIMKGMGLDNKKILLSAESEVEMKKLNIQSRSVREFNPWKNNGGRLAPFEYNQIGNEINSGEGQWGKTKIYSTLKFVAYWTWEPTGEQECWFVPGSGIGDPGHTECVDKVRDVQKVSAIVQATYRGTNLWGNYLYFEPNYFEVDWAFKVGGTPYAGNYITCCTQNFEVLMEDELSLTGDVTDLDITVKAVANDTGGNEATSKVRFVWTY